MKRTAAFVVATLALLVAVPAAGQDLTGSWDISYTMETPRGSMERTVTVHLLQDGASLTGTAEVPPMGPRGGGQARAVDISEGQVGEGMFSFSIVMGGEQRSFTLTFNGSAQGDTMEGTLTMPRGSDAPFTGKRR